MQLTPEHEQLRETLSRFIQKEINPYVDDWEEAHEFPSHALFKKLGDLGLLGVKYDPAYGGMAIRRTTQCYAPIATAVLAL